jgi:hypothetical protein
MATALTSTKLSYFESQQSLQVTGNVTGHVILATPSAMSAYAFQFVEQSPSQPIENCFDIESI